MLAVMQSAFAQNNLEVSSPDKSISVSVYLKEKKLFYTVSKNKEKVLTQSALGIVREDEDFSKNLLLLAADKVVNVKDSYTLKNGKRLVNNYNANKRIFHFKTQSAKPLDVIFQVSNDGVAFRYYFPDKGQGIKKVSAEETSFHFANDTKAWLQPMSEAKTGFGGCHPSYEEYYEKDIPVGKASPSPAGWVFPALFHTKNNWVVITETALDGNYCASRLGASSPEGEYKLTFPDKREGFTNQNVYPEAETPWYTPWRILAIGSLKQVTESTLGTDLALPAKSNINPNDFKLGKASWSWIMYKDNSIVYDVQKKYIDYAADMKWEYCLIDVNWDKNIGYEKINELNTYAKQKNVDLILWYNSAGDWNSVKYTPKDKLLTHEGRVAEFSKLQSMGIKAIKVDFFGGDGQSMIKYYLDIFEDAAKYGIAVNCHGATLPRGWQRTYPNLVTMESIKGEEFVTFEQKNADEEPIHATTIPFTRNIFDPMDFTPTIIYKIPGIQRKTTSAFELALTVIFNSGVQHLAESPEGMAKQPAFIKSYLQQLPAAWVDTKFIDGYPGKFVVMARKAGNKWYVAGINAESNPKEITFDANTFKGKKAQLITDGAQPLSFTTNEIKANGNIKINMKPTGGFVLIIEQ